MDRLKLDVRPRTEMRKSHIKKLRDEHAVPGNVSGLNKESQAVEVSLANLAGILKTQHGIHSLIDLRVEGAKGRPELVVIRTLQKDPISRRVRHVDFQRVSLKEKITTTVPVIPIGHAIGVSEGGMLEHVMHELHIRCLPDHIPDAIEADVTDLEVGDHRSLGEIAPPEGIELVGHEGDVVFAVRGRTIQVEAERAEEVTEEAAAEEAPTEEAE